MSLYSRAAFAFFAIFCLAIFAYNLLHASVYVGDLTSEIERFAAPLIIATLFLALNFLKLERRLMIANLLSAIMFSLYAGEVYIAEHGGERRAGWEAALAAGFLLAALTLPAILAPLNGAWSWFGRRLNAVVSPVFLVVLFYGVVTPVGWLMRLRQGPAAAIPRPPRDELLNRGCRQAPSRYEPAILRLRCSTSYVR